MLKLDMSKAFDTISWEILHRVRSAFGFSDGWVDLVKRSSAFAHFPVLINGVLQGFFQATNGVRQGDPISPSLFIIAEGYLLPGFKDF